MQEAVNFPRGNQPSRSRMIQEGEIMNSQLKINEKEAKILNVIGESADLSNKEITEITGYKRMDIISKKLKKFRKAGLVRGPYYELNLGSIGRNRIYSIYSIITFDPENRDLVFGILNIIPGKKWIFPSTDLDRFFVYFQCNHYKHIGKIMKDLSRKKLVQYHLFASQFKWIKRNPNFLGSPIPSSEGLFDECDLPDLSYRRMCTTIRWIATDLTVMQYLQVWSDSPMEIARREYKLNKNIIPYDQIRYSLQKIKKSGIVESMDYHVSPLPREKCSTILFLLSSSRKRTLLKIMDNFGRGCRLHKAYTLAGDTGIMFLWTMPEAFAPMLDIIDRIDVHSRMYVLRSHETPYLCNFSFEPRMFNIESQKWEFPCLEVQKKIEEVMKTKK